MNTLLSLSIMEVLAEKGDFETGDLAARFSLDRRALDMVLNGLVAAGLLTRFGTKFRCAGAQLSSLSVSTSRSWAAGATYFFSAVPSWLRLSEFLGSGIPPERDQRTVGENLARTMHGKALALHANIGAEFQRTFSTVLDVGGGPGTYSILLSRSWQDAKFLLLDLPEVCRVALDIVSDSGALNQITAIPGDYHVTPFPYGNDLVLLFGILHRECESDIRKLLRKTYDCLIPGGEVAVLDVMTDHTRVAPKFSVFFGINMALTVPNGWVFADTDLHGWLHDAGFVDARTKILPEPSPHWLVTARKPE